MSSSSHIPNVEVDAMRRCLELATRGLGNVAPNPMVGAVVLHDGRQIAEGHHAIYGGPHAEVEAIKKAGNVEGATLVVNLEPCSHWGKTPPCTDLIISSGIRRVVAGCVDASAKVSGRGLEALRAAKIDVATGVLEKEAIQLNRRFFTFHRRHRPYIILKWAETADGFIARSDGSSKWISSRGSRALVHQWRAEEQAIMVGTRTAILDNPRLTARLNETATNASEERTTTNSTSTSKNPLRVVLDRNGSIPVTHNLFDESAKTLVFTERRVSNLPNATFVRSFFDADVLDQVMEALSERQILSLIVEGGTVLLQSFINRDLWDEARIFRSKSDFGSGVQAPRLPGSSSVLPLTRRFIEGKDELIISSNHWVGELG